MLALAMRAQALGAAMVAHLVRVTSPSELRQFAPLLQRSLQTTLNFREARVWEWSVPALAEMAVLLHGRDESTGAPDSHFVAVCDVLVEQADSLAFTGPEHSTLAQIALQTLSSLLPYLGARSAKVRLCSRARVAAAAFDLCCRTCAVHDPRVSHP